MTPDGNGRPSIGTSGTYVQVPFSRGVENTSFIPLVQDLGHILWAVHGFFGAGLNLQRLGYRNIGVSDTRNGTQSAPKLTHAYDRICSV